jgi:hypothetical protein
MQALPRTTAAAPTSEPTQMTTSEGCSPVHSFDTGGDVAFGQVAEAEQERLGLGAGPQAVTAHAVQADVALPGGGDDVLFGAACPQGGDGVESGGQPGESQVRRPAGPVPRLRRAGGPRRWPRMRRRCRS